MNARHLLAPVALALAACGGGSSPSEPSTRQDVINSTSTLALEAVALPDGSSRSLATGNVIPAGGNVQCVTELVSATARVEGGPACPQNYAAWVVTASGRSVPVWEYETLLPCPHPGPPAPGEPGELVTYRDASAVPALANENAPGSWSLRVAGPSDLRRTNTIRVTLASSLRQTCTVPR
jgi:hypothetical protein